MSTVDAIPLARVTTTELRKMFDTRSGFWLLAGIGLLSLLATSSVILFASEDQLTYGTFTAAVSTPMAVVLPIIAILSVSSEWSQRSGLTTFTLVAKAVSCVGVAIVTIPLAFGIGAAGNVIGPAIAGLTPVWDLTLANLLSIILANVLGLLVGFMLGLLIRASAGAVVAYFVYAFLLPSLSLLLAASQEWYRELQPWVDFDHAQKALLDGALTASQWAHLAVTGLLWLVVPLVVGLALVRRAEVK
jgi:hypothetical protein